MSNLYCINDIIVDYIESQKIGTDISSDSDFVSFDNIVKNIYKNIGQNIITKLTEFFNNGGELLTQKKYPCTCIYGLHSAIFLILDKSIDIDITDVIDPDTGDYINTSIPLNRKMLYKIYYDDHDTRFRFMYLDDTSLRKLVHALYSDIDEDERDAIVLKYLLN